MGNEIQNFSSEKKSNLEFMGGPVLTSNIYYYFGCCQYFSHNVTNPMVKWYTHKHMQSILSVDLKVFYPSVLLCWQCLF